MADENEQPRNMLQVILRNLVANDDDSESDEEPDDTEMGDDEEDENGNTESSSKVSYDKSLPGTHSYLGSDFEEVRGRTVHDDDSYLSLPVISLPGVVLMPGQTLPLHVFQSSTVAMISHVVDRDKTFGLVTSRYMGDSDMTLASIGTTAEILAIKEENDAHVGITTVRVKAIGRQRFEIKETRRQADGIVIAKVKILSERVLPDPLEGARPPSHARLVESSEPNGNLYMQTEAGAAGDQSCLPDDRPFRTNTRKRIDRLSCANHTWWPPWVYRQYDVYYIMKKVKDELQSWNETLKEHMMPRDPTDFSFWVAGNLPLDDNMKLHLLKLDSAVQRLRCELSIMLKCTVLCCRECELVVANKKDVFSMALEGPLGAFVNPTGYVHETLTLNKAHGLSLVGRPSTQHSWFPGYAWTIAQCRHCSAHMGWKFTAVKKGLKPEKFWGLCRSSLQPGLQKDADNSEELLPIM